jgi:hypothetical protein
MSLATIEIDLDIHKLIEQERRSFDEPPYKALRRLLGLLDLQGPDHEAAEPSSEGKPWRESVIAVPHGSEARMSYRRGSQVFLGQFLNGKLIVNGQSFDTLSAAASTLARTKKGTAPNLNGWNYWEAKFPSETTWRSLQELRREALKGLNVAL